MYSGLQSLTLDWTLFSYVGALPLLSLPPAPHRWMPALRPVPKLWATDPALSGILSFRLSLFLHQGVLVSKPLSKVSPFLHVQPNILKLAVQLFSQLPALLKCQPSRQHHCLPRCHQILCPVQKSLWRTAAASASMAPADQRRCRGELFQEEPAQPFFLVLV